MISQNKNKIDEFHEIDNERIKNVCKSDSHIMINPYISKDNPYLPEIIENTRELHLLQHKKENIDKNIPTPTSLRISTITAVCNINQDVNLLDFYKSLILQPDESGKYIIRCFYSTYPEKRCEDIDFKNRKIPKKPFQNQATFIVYLGINSNNIKRYVNLKLFRNGKIQMTGLKNEEEGYETVNILIRYLKKYRDADYNLSDFDIVLINSDYSAKFKIKRELLYEILFHKKIFVSYEPDIYPGVNAKYYWNTHNVLSNGICKCKKKCDGKGNGIGDGNCKKITIAIFQSGNVIITGARKFQQTEDAYIFINKIFTDNYLEISRCIENKISISNLNLKIDISNIVNFSVRQQILEI